jgi:hypothetical protein
MPVAHSVQTVHLSCVEINTISKMDQNEIPLDPRHLGVPSEVLKMISMLVLHLAQTISKRIEMNFCLIHVA